MHRLRNITHPSISLHRNATQGEGVGVGEWSRGVDLFVWWYFGDMGVRWGIEGLIGWGLGIESVLKWYGAED